MDDFIMRPQPSKFDFVDKPVEPKPLASVAVPASQGTTPYQDGGMLRFNSGKVPLALLPSSYTYYAGMGLAYGAIKYDANNWRRGGLWSQAYESLQRHLDAWREGEDFDQESGLPHLALAGCNLAFLTEFFDKGIGTDDRFRYDGQAGDARKPGRVLQFRRPPNRSQPEPGPGAGQGDASGAGEGTG